MPNRRPKLWKLLCCCIMALSLVVMARSFFAIDKVSYASGELLAPGQGGIPAASPVVGQPPWYTFRIHTWWALTMGGSLSVGLDDYDSMGSDGDALAAQWKSSLGFVAESFSGRPGLSALFQWDLPSHGVFFGTGYHNVMRQGVTTRAVVIPLWFIALLAALPIVSAWRRERSPASRRARGLCIHCRYSRAGIPSERPCPECGREDTPTTSTC